MSATDLSVATVCYRLSLPRPENHLVDVELEIAAPQGTLPSEPIDLTMAAWSPGSYLIRDYARFVRGVSARGGARDDARGDARTLAVDKRDKQTWRITVPADEPVERVVVSYQVYGRDLTVRTNHIDGTHAFLHGPATYLLVAGRRDAPCRVEIRGPKSRDAGRDWVVATGLPVDSSSPGGWRADSWDQLLDCPIHIGESEVRTAEVAGTAIRLFVWGRMAPGPMGDIDTLFADLRAIIAVHAERLGGRIPCEEYTFILMLSPGGYGGLEHCNSSANLHTSFCMESKKSYLGLLELLSHEFFHVWNGKRIFPEALGRFDYSREGYTRCLWVMEGLTSYYDRHTLVRAGRMTGKRYLEKLAEEWSRLQAIPGRAVQSLEESSFDAWIKLYKPHESNVNTTVSYYLEGGLAALVTDLQIRARTEDARSLDDVLARLWRDYGETGKPYPEDLQPIFEDVTGVRLTDFFERVVRGHEDPDLGTALSLVGLELREQQTARNGNGNGNGNNNNNNNDDEPETLVWLGVTLEQGTRIATVLDGSPAARAGLSPKDTIIACDGWQVKSGSELDKRLRGRAAGQSVDIAVFRRRQLTTLAVELDSAPPKRVEIAARADAGDIERARYTAWLGEEFPAPGKLAATTGARWV